MHTLFFGIDSEVLDVSSTFTVREQPVPRRVHRIGRCQVTPAPGRRDEAAGAAAALGISSFSRNVSPPKSQFLQTRYFLSPKDTEITVILMVKDICV